MAFDMALDGWWYRASTEVNENTEEIVMETNDLVNSPKHYQILPGVQMIDIRDALLDKIQTSGTLNARQIDYWSRAFEYLGRFMEKDGERDLRKAQWYLNRLIESLNR